MNITLLKGTKMKKILLTNTNCSWNKGSAAQVVSTVTTLRSLNKNIDFTLISHYPEIDKKCCDEHEIHLVNCAYFSIPMFKLIFHLITLPIIKLGLKKIISKNKVVKSYLESDLIIDLSGDTFSDGKAGNSFLTLLTLYFAFFLKKPLAIYSQSIGPFRKIYLPFLKRGINRANLLIIREKITEKYLKEVGISSKIYLFPDCAFALNSSSDERILKIMQNEGISLEKSIIGISANAMVGDKNYIEVMAKISDYLVEKTNAQIVFIPHVISIKKGDLDDDRLIAKKIISKSKNKSECHIIRGDYFPEELKGVISRCEIFIGGRMHSNIASLSSGVPTIATSWSHKYQGIMDHLGQGEYVCDIKNIEYENLKLKIDKLWLNKENIRKKLDKESKKERKSVFKSCELIQDLIH